MRRVLVIVFTLLCCASLRAASSSYLFIWAGDAEHKASDFLAVIDADPRSAHYGANRRLDPDGQAGTHPHHTEHEMPAAASARERIPRRTQWLFDLIAAAASADSRIVRRPGRIQPSAHVHPARQMATS